MSKLNFQPSFGLVSLLPLSSAFILFGLPDRSYAETETYFQEITSIAQSCNLGLIEVIYNSHALYMQVGLTCYLTHRSSSLAQCALQENRLDHTGDALMDFEIISRNLKTVKSNVQCKCTPLGTQLCQNEDV